MGHVVVAGVPGVGKSTLVSAICNEIGRTFVSLGSMMLEIAMKCSVVTSRDQIRRLPAGQQLALLQQAAERITASTSDAIVDTHLLVATSRGYVPGLPRSVAELLSPETVVLIEAPPDQIARRRATDGLRVRNLQSSAAIAEHIALTRAAAASICILTSARLFIVDNSDSNLVAARQSLIELLTGDG